MKEDMLESVVFTFLILFDCISTPSSGLKRLFKTCRRG